MISGPADPKSSQAQPSWVVGPKVPPASRLGQLIDGEFLIKGILGQGELGVTYEADNIRFKRCFAVLMLSRELKPTHGMMLAVRDDLRRAQQLTAAGLMPVKLIADRDGIPGFATELLDGETLRQRLSRGPLRLERALGLILSVARTLEAAHKVGLFHGDLRPENIFLVRPSAKSTFAGKAMLVEHALYHLRRRVPGLDDRLPLYKLMYRPPEQVLGEAGASEQGDVWVLGAILYECLTGKPAFYAEEPEFVLDNLGSPPPVLAANLAIGLAEPTAAALNVLIGSACARDLKNRVANMGEFVEGLEQVLRGSALELKEVVVESREEAEAAPQLATPLNRRMNRLLQRLSGVFPQIELPGPTGQPQEGSPPLGLLQGAEPALDGSPLLLAEKPVSLPKFQAALAPITPPKERVSRILQTLSSTLPIVNAAPDGAVSEAPASLPASPPLGSTNEPPARSQAPCESETSQRTPEFALESAKSPVAPAATVAYVHSALSPHEAATAAERPAAAATESGNKPEAELAASMPSPSASASAPVDVPAASETTPLAPLLSAVPAATEASSAPPKEVSISSAATPKASLPEKKATTPSYIALDATLQPEDLAALMEASNPSSPALAVKEAAEAAKALAKSPPTFKAVSDLPSRPAADSSGEKLGIIRPASSEFSEQATQPALPHIPIAELATQAKLDVISTVATAATLQTIPAQVLAEREPQAETPVASPPATPSNKDTPELATLPVVSAIADKPQPPRPPRVSQLIAAVQLQQGSPPPAPPAPPPSPAEPPVNSPSSPRRVSPGLIAPAPDLFAPSNSSLSPQLGPRTERLSRTSQPITLQNWLLRHQEAIAALLGAVLVILAALLYLFFKS